MFREALAPDSIFQWESSLGHLIPRTPIGSGDEDACLEGAGGFSFDLLFWWHLMSPPEVQARTLLYKADNTDGTFISINVLEYVTVII